MLCISCSNVQGVAGTQPAAREASSSAEDSILMEHDEPRGRNQWLLPILLLLN